MTEFEQSVQYLNDRAINSKIYVYLFHGFTTFYISSEFSVPQVEYPLGGSRKKGSHVYFLLIVAMVLQLWHQIVLLSHQVTMIASEQHLYQTIVLPRKLATGSIHDYFFATANSGYSNWSTENWSVSHPFNKKYKA